MNHSNNTPKPTAKELEILQILWKMGSCSVKEVHEQLGGVSTNGYTTILKILQIMTEKGLVTREKEGKLHLYKPAHSQENTSKAMLDKIIDSVFDGSASSLVLSALGNRKSSKEELKEIRAYLDKLEGTK